MATAVATSASAAVGVRSSIGTKAACAGVSAASSSPLRGVRLCQLHLKSNQSIRTIRNSKGFVSGIVGPDAQNERGSLCQQHPTRRQWQCHAAGGRGQGGPETFLTMEEAGLVEMAGLDMHERFLARLTISSLNLLRVIAEQEGVPIEELNAGRVCDWFAKDKQKRAEDPDNAVLKWDGGPQW